VKTEPIPIPYPNIIDKDSIRASLEEELKEDYMFKDPYVCTRGVQKDPKPKTRTEKPDTRTEFSGTRTEIFNFSVRVPKPIILSGYRFGYESGSLPKRVLDNPIFFVIF